MEKTEGGVELCRRQYKKVLVIGEHEFFTGEKSILLQEEEEKKVGYRVAFGVKGSW